MENDNTGNCPKCNQVNADSATHCVGCKAPLTWASMAVWADPPQPQTSITPPVAAPPALVESANMTQSFGGGGALIGIAIALYYIVFFNTSAPVDTPGFGVGPVDIPELLAQRRRGIALGIVISLVGLAFCAVGNSLPKEMRPPDKKTSVVFEAVLVFILFLIGTGIVFALRAIVV